MNLARTSLREDLSRVPYGGCQAIPILMEYGFTQEIQFRFQERWSPHLSSTGSFEAVYKAILLGHGRQLLPSNPAFQLEYRNGLRAAEAYEEDFQVDQRFFSFEEDPKFEAAVRK